MSQRRVIFAWKPGAVLLVALLLFGAACGAGPASAEPAPLHPLEESRPVELAPYMAELGRLFHKLALSIDAGNAELARFYAYESKIQLERIQNDVPVYNGFPIAILVSRFAIPSLSSLADRLAEPSSPNDRTSLLEGLDRALDRCNACHIATEHAFLRITRGTEVNPFNQDFRPITKESDTP